MTSLSHIEHLAEGIGPRGSATPAEKQAHTYCSDVLSRLGYKTHEEQFLSTASAYRPFILASLSILVSCLLFYRTSFQALALIVAAIAMASAFLELLFLPHVIRWILPKKQSQNVYAIAKAQSIARQKIVLVAHVDSHRTPLIWHSPLTYKIYRLMSTLGMVAFTGLFLSMLICFLVNHEIASYLSALCGFFILLVLIMTLQAELSSFTKGANDNASGAGIVLALAEKFAQAPLLHSEIWFVFTGCEEVGAHGSFDFVKKQRHELGKAKFIAIDNIAGKDTAPRYYVSETLLRKMKYPKEMIDLVRSVADENPEFDAKPYSQRGVYTDGTPFLLSGIPGIAVVGHREDGWIPDWHSKTDTFENVDSHALSRAQGFIEKLVERMDENV